MTNYGRRQPELSEEFRLTECSGSIRPFGSRACETQHGGPRTATLVETRRELRLAPPTDDSSLRVGHPDCRSSKLLSMWRLRHGAARAPCDIHLATWACRTPAPFSPTSRRHRSRRHGAQYRLVGGTLSLCRMVRCDSLRTAWHRKRKVVVPLSLPHSNRLWREG